jgi:hypothetical protein
MNEVDVGALWRFFPLGYAASVAFEGPVLWFGLSPSHSRRLFAACWLTSATYPIVALLLPVVIEPRWGRFAYIVIAELFAPLAECFLFAMAFPAPLATAAGPANPSRARDMMAIVLANLVSFVIGGWVVHTWW